MANPSVATKATQTEGESRLEKFAKDGSLIGLRYAIYSKSRERRIVWIFWLVFGLCLAIYQIQDRFVYYFSYPYNTEFQINAVNELRFPQVTICKEDWISKSKAKEFGIYEIIEARTKLLEDMFASGDFNATEYTEQLRELNAQLDKLTKDWDVLLKNISHQWEDLVTYISWNGVKNRSIVEEMETDLGHCFSIGSDTMPLIATEVGLRSGLEIFLNARQSDSVIVSTSGHEIFTGFRLLIHDPNEVPRMLDTGFVISPGTVTQVAVTSESITQLGPPYSDCNTDPYYRVVNCLAGCEDYYFLYLCGCKPFYYIGSDDFAKTLPVCSLVKHEACLEKYQTNRRTLNNYECICDQQCHGLTYDNSLSQSKISNKMLGLVEAMIRFDDRSSHVNESLAAENNTEHDLTIIYIYFPNLVHKNITSTTSYSPFALLCDVGGALSLLLGATLLTLYEMAEFLVPCFLNSRLGKFLSNQLIRCLSRLRL